MTRSDVLPSQLEGGSRSKRVKSAGSVHMRPRTIGANNDNGGFDER